MKKRLIHAATITLALILLRDSANSQNNTVTEPQKQLMKEVLQLRADFLQFWLEARQSSVRALRRNLDQLHEQERRVQEAEEGRGEQVAQIEQQLSSPDLESETRPEVEAVRQQLIGDTAEKLRAEQSALRQHQADLTARLESELQRVHALQQRAEQIEKALAD